MPSVQWSLVYILILLAGSTLFAQSNGWKIETLTPIATNQNTSTQLIIPTRIVATNDVGQIAFVRPDGVYVREASGALTKRIDEVALPFVLRGASEVSLIDGIRTSVGIDNDAVVYASQSGKIYRQAPGQTTEVILSTPSFPSGEPTLSADTIVTESGNVFASVISRQPGVGFNSQDSRSDIA